MIEWNLESYRADQHANQPIQPDVPAAQLLSQISVPTLFAWGALDESTVDLAGRKLATEVRGAQSHVFDGVAHMVNLERPAEFNRLVREFLDGAEGAARLKPA